MAERRPPYWDISGLGDAGGWYGAPHGPGGGNGGGGMANLEARVTNLEQTVSEIRSTLSRVDERTSNLATKADVESMARRLIQWTVGTIIAVAVLVFTIVRFTSSA